MLARLAACSLLAITYASNVSAQTTPTATPMPVVIVAEPVPPAPVIVTKLTVPSADGSQTHEYDVSDFSFSMARSFSYTSTDAKAEVSATISIAKGVDEHLLQWARQTATEADQARTVSLRSDNPDAPKVFDLEGARIIGLSLSGGSMSMISLQIGLRSLTIDGVRMN